jgi:prevent-host-death family protein
VAEAKARLSEIIEHARSGGPQMITRHGRDAVVLVSAEEWARKTKRQGSLADFLTSSPLAGSGLKVPRRRDRSRPIDL